MILRSFFRILNIDVKVSIGYFLSISLLSIAGLSSVIYLFIFCSLSLSLSFAFSARILDELDRPVVFF